MVSSSSSKVAADAQTVFMMGQGVAEAAAEGVARRPGCKRILLEAHKQPRTSSHAQAGVYAYTHFGVHEHM